MSVGAEGRCCGESLPGMQSIPMGKLEPSSSPPSPRLVQTETLFKTPLFRSVRERTSVEK